MTLRIYSVSVVQPQINGGWDCLTKTQHSANLKGDV